jgi:hypothetical protein
VAKHYGLPLYGNQPDSKAIWRDRTRTTRELTWPNVVPLENWNVTTTTTVVDENDPEATREEIEPMPPLSLSVAVVMVVLAAGPDGIFPVEPWGRIGSLSAINDPIAFR